jgi:hypothetical protein
MNDFVVVVVVTVHANEYSPVRVWHSLITNNGMENEILHDNNNNNNKHENGADNACLTKANNKNSQYPLPSL